MQIRLINFRTSNAYKMSAYKMNAYFANMMRYEANREQNPI